MDPEALKNLSPSQKEEIMTAVQQQVALANMQVKILFNKLTFEVELQLRKQL